MLNNLKIKITETVSSSGRRVIYFTIEDRLPKQIFIVVRRKIQDELEKLFRDCYVLYKSPKESVKNIVDERSGNLDRFRMEVEYEAFRKPVDRSSSNNTK